MLSMTRSMPIIQNVEIRSSINMLRAIKYPLTITNGSLAFSTDVDIIVDRIFSVLETRPGERLEQNSYGTPSFIFDTVNNVTLILARIEVALLEQIPELSRLNLSGTVSGNVIAIAIEFSYQETLKTLTVQIAL